MRFSLVIIFLLLSSNVCQADIATGLIGYWKFNEGSGASAADSGSSNNTLNFGNAPSWVSGRISKGLDLNGTDQYASKTNPNSLHANNITVSAWVKPSSTGTHQTIICYRAGTYQLYFDAAGAVFLTLRSGGGAYTYRNVASSLTIKYGAWNLVAASYDGSNTLFYVNGAAETIGSNYGNISNQNVWDYLDIGSGVYERVNTLTNSWFSGSIDEVRIYSRALTMDDLAELYDYGRFVKLRNANLKNFKVKQ